MGSDPISKVYDAMAAIGYEDGLGYENWEKRVQLFHVTRTGGIAFVSDPLNPSIWWVNVYCPKARPTDNTFNFLAALAFSSGCKLLRSEVRRAGSARMLEKVGFLPVGKGLYERFG